MAFGRSSPAGKAQPASRPRAALYGASVRKAIVGFTLTDELFASPEHPLPPARQRQLTDALAPALDLLARPEGAGHYEWTLIAACGNVLEQLIEWGVCADAGGLLPEAHAALRASLEANRLRHEPLRLADAALLACRFLVHDFAEILAECPGRTFVRAVRRVDRRMVEIQSGKRRAGDFPPIPKGVAA